MNHLTTPLFLFYLLLFSLLSMSTCIASDASSRTGESALIPTTQDLISVQRLEFDSKSLSRNQSASIYLPNSYPHSQKHYPVIFVMDADFLMTTAINTVNIRAQRELMPEAIIVGFHTPDYQSRLSIGMPMKRQQHDKQVIFADGNPEAFLQFVELEVMPYLKQHFPVAEHSTIIGMSPTVGVVLTDYLKTQPLFNSHIALAADVNLLNAEGIPLTDLIVKQARTSSPTPLYVSVGGLDFTNNPSLKTAVTNLQKMAKTHKLDAKLKAEIIEGGEHYGMSLVAINNGLNQVFPEAEWQPDYLTIREQAHPKLALQQHYQSLSERYGIPTYPVVDGYWMGFSIAGTNRYLLRKQQQKKAIELLLWALEGQPNNAVLLYNLAGAYNQDGQKSAAVSAINKAIALAKAHRDDALSDYQAYLTKLTN